MDEHNDELMVISDEEELQPQSVVLLQELQDDSDDEISERDEDEPDDTDAKGLHCDLLSGAEYTGEYKWGWVDNYLINKWGCVE